MISKFQALPELEGCRFCGRVMLAGVCCDEALESARKLRIERDKKPPRVEDVYAVWLEAPKEHSARCLYWEDRIRRGWRPNKRIRGMGYSTSSEFYGIYVWEYLNVICPLLEKLESELRLRPP